MKHFKSQLWLDRIIYGGSLRQISVLLISALSIFLVVGCVMVFGFGQHIGHSATVDRSEPFWQLYYYFIDGGNQIAMVEKTGGSRIIGLIMGTLGSIFVTGLLISTISNMLERRVQRCRDGRNYYKFSDHVVIIGSDQMVQGIVKQMLSTDVHHIVILTSDNVETLRSELQAPYKEKKMRQRIIVNYGTRDSEQFLRRINVTAAREVYILGDYKEFDEIESYHDSLNVECLKLIAKLCREAGRRGLLCNVSFNYKTTYHVFQYADLSADITDYVNFHPFNFDELWARQVVVAGSSPDGRIKYRPLDYRPITSADTDEYVHLIVIGLSHMGQAMALQAAHVAHFPNYRRRKTRITIVDRNMWREMDEFKQKCGALFDFSESVFIDADRCDKENGNIADYVRRYPFNDEAYRHLVTDQTDKYFIDLKWTFINGDDCNPKVRELLSTYANDKEAIVTVAVCLNLTHCSLRSAMYLPDAYYAKQIPVLVQQRKTETMVDTLNGKLLPDDKRALLRYKNLTPFGMVYDCYDLRLNMLQIYSKRISAAYTYFFDYRTPPMHIDDETAERLWHDLPITKRWSNIFAAASIPTKLRSIGYDTQHTDMQQLYIEPITEEQIKMLAEMEHNRWNVEELLLGYRPVSADEDAAIDADKSLKGKYKKQYVHYDIRPYDGLKEDASHCKASIYDEMIVCSIPTIINSKPTPHE